MSTTTNKKQRQQQEQPIPLVKQARATLTRLEEKDPGLKRELEKAQGYAVFPSVGKASLVVGGSYGRGAVFERGNKLIGYATITQLTLGVQLGGDTFSEIVILRTPEALDRFKSGHMAFAANASTVLVKAGASATSNFKGVKTLAYSRGGMLLELAIGGQKFKFRPLDGQESKGGKSGGRQGGSAKGAEGASEDSGGEEDEDSLGAIGRTVGGVRGAASKATALAKDHPVLAGFAAAGLAAGLAIWVVRSVRNQAQGGGEQEGSGEQDDDESDDHAEDEIQDQDEGDDEGQQDDEGQEEESGEEESRNGFRRGGRARA